MSSSNKIIGKFFIRAGGTLLPISGDASLEGGGVEREPVVLNDGSVKFREVIKEAVVECTLTKTGDIGLKQIQAIEDATINVEADTGERWVIANAFCTSVPKMNSKGEVEVKFAGAEAEETGA